jgi:hypothetical protein
MATLTRTSPTAVPSGSGSFNAGAADASMTAVATSDIVTNADGRTWLWISNQGGSTDTVTITAQNTNQYSAAGVSLTPSTLSVAILTTQRVIIGPIPASVYNDSGGNITINHSFITTVRILALAMPQIN